MGDLLNTINTASEVTHFCVVCLKVYEQAVAIYKEYHSVSISDDISLHSFL